MSASLMVLLPLVLLALAGSLCFVGCGRPFETGPGPGPSGPTPLGPYGDAVSTTAGFVACWPLNDKKDSATAVDIGPHGFNGNAVGAVAFGQNSIVPGDTPNGAASHCASFTGGFVQVGFQPELNPQKSFSIECWVQVASIPSPAAVMIVVASNDPSDPNNLTGYQLHATAEQTWAASIGIGPGPGSQFLIAKPPVGSPPTVAVGVPTYLVATFDAATGTLQLYVNGFPSGLPATIMPPMPPFSPAIMPTPFAIGALSTAGSTQAQYPFNGEIQDVAFYNGVLSPGDMSKHLSQGRGMG